MAATGKAEKTCNRGTKQDNLSDLELQEKNNRDLCKALALQQQGKQRKSSRLRETIQRNLPGRELQMTNLSVHELLQGCKHFLELAYNTCSIVRRKTKDVAHNDSNLLRMILHFLPLTPDAAPGSISFVFLLVLADSWLVYVAS